MIPVFKIWKANELFEFSMTVANFTVILGEQG